MKAFSSYTVSLKKTNAFNKWVAVNNAESIFPSCNREGVEATQAFDLQAATPFLKTIKKTTQDKEWEGEAKLR